MFVQFCVVKRNPGFIYPGYGDNQFLGNHDTIVLFPTWYNKKRIANLMNLFCQTLFYGISIQQWFRSKANLTYIYVYKYVST